MQDIFPVRCGGQDLKVKSMEYIRGKINFSQERDSVITLGKFDGVHIGHQKLINTMEKAKGGRESIVFAFDVPSIQKNKKEAAAAALQGDALNPEGLQKMEKGEPGVLTTNKERADFIETLGVDKLIECPFVPEISGMAAEDFLKEVLVGQLKAKEIFVGPDFHFGYKRSGDVALLAACQEGCGYRLTVVEKACYQGEEVSSTGIRNRIREGRLEEAVGMLGRELFYSGRVVYGNQLGRTIGFPTANLLVQPEKVAPPFGVYAATFFVEDKILCGIANIGRKPTIQAGDGHENPIGIETYLFDFHEDLYGREAKVVFHAFIRPERVFDSVEALKEEIQKNEKQVRAYFAQKGK